jgi:predicted nucleic acid-binding protein
MTLIICDTSPLNYLILIEEADILPALYGRVIIPQAVLTELQKPETPEKVRTLIATSPAWIEVAQMRSKPDASLSKLGEGEREAITLALDLQADAVLIDETRGREAARLHGLRIVGTLGVLYEAAGAGFCDLEKAFDKLRQTSFRASEKLYEYFLELHKKGG